MTAALEGGEWSAARPGRTLPPGKTRHPFYRRLGGPQGRSGRAENLVHTGIRSPDRPARSTVRQATRRKTRTNQIPTSRTASPQEEAKRIWTTNPQHKIWKTKFREPYVS